MSKPRKLFFEGCRLPQAFALRGARTPPPSRIAVRPPSWTASHKNSECAGERAAGRRARRLTEMQNRLRSVGSVGLLRPRFRLRAVGVTRGRRRAHHDNDADREPGRRRCGGLLMANGRGVGPSSRLRRAGAHVHGRRRAKREMRRGRSAWLPTCGRGYPPPFAAPFGPLVAVPFGRGRLRS